ncbi:MAG: restriction endonuclease [Brevundimonas sp.]|jgi:restriction system protein|nr:MAG: restriction endonuclease [Brevundimonas sp.]
MGGIHWPRAVLSARLGEAVGLRSGLALTTEEMATGLTGQNLDLDLAGDPGVFVRTDAQKYEDAVGVLLFHLGVRDTADVPPPGYIAAVRLNREHGIRLDPEQAAALGGLVGTRVLEWVLRPTDAYEADIRDALTEWYGDDAEAAFEAIVEATREYALVTPYAIRDALYPDEVALSDLFHSERLPAEEEVFFDQRFINYLARNPDQLGTINWRQFEGLTGEWFSREGYNVDIGPGRNDDGVDVRMSRTSADGQGPETVLVQCKREKGKIQKVVVKGLYADILNANATSGLVVTTSSLSPGAQKVINARGYPIQGIDRTIVGKWIQDMAQPGRGTDMV